MYNIAIYQKQDMHTEIFGMFLEMFIKYKRKIKFTIYYDSVNSFCDYLMYYKKLFGVELCIKKTSELKRDITDYDWVIMLTSNDTIDNEIIKKHSYKIIFIIHYINFVKPYMKYMLSLSPIVKFPNKNKLLKHVLPIYTIDNNYTIKKRNILSIIGLSSYSSKYKDVDDLENLLTTFQNKDLPESKKYKIHIFSRRNQKMIDRFSKYKNVVFFDYLKTESLLRLLKESKFILPLAKKDSMYHHKLLTGSIPMGISNNIPIVMDDTLFNIYKVKGSIIYKSNLTEIMEKLITIPDKEYEFLVSEIIKYKNCTMLENNEVLKDLLFK